MSHFFAYISRLKLIRRWSLMRSITKENSQEHSWQVATVAHALALIQNKFYGGKVQADRVAVLGLYHDISETITGDLPTPIKYANQDIETAYHSLEAQACQRLTNMLPTALQAEYQALLQPEEQGEILLVHIADKICAYIKCAEELAAGNHEFAVAYELLSGKIAAYEQYPEVAYFMKHFGPSFRLTLDELK